MNKLHNANLTGKAKFLRKNITKEERHLWYDFLKKLLITVNRQKIMGNYIVDFYIAKSKLIIELDGSQHYQTEKKNNDIIRDSLLKQQGYTVLRYSNKDINENFNAVCQDILNHINKSTNTVPKPSP